MRFFAFELEGCILPIHILEAPNQEDAREYMYQHVFPTIQRRSDAKILSVRELDSDEIEAVMKQKDWHQNN